MCVAAAKDGRTGQTDRSAPKENIHGGQESREEKPTKKGGKMVQIKRYYNNSAQKNKNKIKFKLNAKHSTKKKHAIK